MTVKSNNSLIKIYASQSRADVAATSISPLLLRKQRQSQSIPANLVLRPNLQSQGNPSSLKSNRTVEKKGNSTTSSQPADPQSRLATRGNHHRSETITYTTLIPTPRRPPINPISSTGRSTAFNLSKVLSHTHTSFAQTHGSSFF